MRSIMGGGNISTGNILFDKTTIKLCYNVIVQTQEVIERNRD